MNQQPCTCNDGNHDRAVSDESYRAKSLSQGASSYNCRGMGTVDPRSRRPRFLFASGERRLFSRRRYRHHGSFWGRWTGDVFPLLASLVLVLLCASRGTLAGSVLAGENLIGDDDGGASSAAGQREEHGKVATSRCAGGYKCVGVAECAQRCPPKFVPFGASGCLHFAVPTDNNREGRGACPAGTKSATVRSSSVDYCM